MSDVSDDRTWHRTACILCSQNCGIEVELDGRTLNKIRGDKAHPASRGYACEKAQRLDYYQNAKSRLTSPLRRRCVAALMARSRRSIGTPRSARSPSGWRACATRTGATRSSITRDPSWRKQDLEGALRISAIDAARLGISDGARARITTKAGSVTTVVEITDTLQAGHASLPNGLGIDYAGDDGRPVVHGVALNELTSSADRDWIAGTPWHKHVPARSKRSS